MLLTEGIDEKREKGGTLKKKQHTGMETAREQFINIIEKDEEKGSLLLSCSISFSSVFYVYIFFFGRTFSPRSIFCAKRFELR